MKKLLMSMRVTEAVNYKEKRNSIAYDYINFFEHIGYTIILIPNNTKNILNYFNLNIDLVVLSGGNNVSSELYDSNYRLDDVYNDRDELEYKLVSYSIEKKIPVLGICRGFHFLNVYFGGSISHHIPNHVNKVHTLLSKDNILNKKKANTFHNQSILANDLSNELTVLARAKDDNIVEAFYNKKRKILGIQWHPERQKKKYDIKLIEKFVEGKL